MNDEIVLAMRGLGSALRSLQKARSSAFDILVIWTNRFVDGAERTSQDAIDAEKELRYRTDDLLADLQGSSASADLFAVMLTAHKPELETSPEILGIIRFLLEQLETELDNADVLVQRLTRIRRNPATY